jgi:predicted deacylase
MTDDKSMIGTSLDFDQDGLQTGTLSVPHSVHRSAYGHIAIPIAVAKNGSSPTVLLTGGVHGDEYEGPIALAKLIRGLDLSRLSGRIVVPAVNYPAFLAGTRTSPIDAVNLNRTLPGRRNGTVTETIAHYVTTNLMPRSDYLLDFHAGRQLAAVSANPACAVSPVGELSYRNETITINGDRTGPIAQRLFDEFGLHHGARPDTRGWTVAID